MNKKTYEKPSVKVFPLRKNKRTVPLLQKVCQIGMSFLVVA